MRRGRGLTLRAGRSAAATPTSAPRLQRSHDRTSPAPRAVFAVRAPMPYAYCTHGPIVRRVFMATPPSKQTRTRMSVDARRNQMLDIGVNLIATQRVEDISIDEVIARAGVSR